MENLVLDSLEIRNFRGFKHLQIEHLRRVNLVVGKNNIGKSSLIEALQLYAHNGNPGLIWKMLQARDESRPYNSRREVLDYESLLLELRYLFYGRKEIGRFVDPAIIGPINSSDETLSIAVKWYTSQRGEEDLLKLRLLELDEVDTVENPSPRLAIQTGKISRNYLIRPRPDALGNDWELKVGCIAIAPNGLDREMVGVLWDGIALTGLENDVVKAMRIIAPGVERLSIVGSLEAKERPIRSIDTRERRSIPIVKVADLDAPIALRSLGDGMQRVFGLALALVNAKDGMLLIDEIENGLHFSVQPDIWRVIFRLAQRLNVQVFATTHSLDCIRAFQEAAQECSQEESLLIRLQNKQGETSSVLYDKEELAIVVQEQIEVR